MFLLITGASGAGKSTARLGVAPVLSPDVECVELHDVIDVPAFPTLAWRQQATEAAVQRALGLQATTGISCYRAIRSQPARCLPLRQRSISRVSRRAYSM